MNLIQQECINRGITRLCHFTQSRNLAHIFGDTFGLCSTKTLKSHNMPYNPTDPNRHDRRNDLICCSIEYPNTYYFLNARNCDPLFKDWVVLLINPSYLWAPETHFCPCNAATSCGGYIQPGIESFKLLYAETSPRINFSRPFSHLSAAPTNIQAEVLLKDPIPLDSIIGIVVESKEQAQREVFRLRLQNISMDNPIYIASDFFKRGVLSSLIQQGIQVTETVY